MSFRAPSGLMYKAVVGKGNRLFDFLASLVSLGIETRMSRMTYTIKGQEPNKFIKTASSSREEYNYATIKFSKEEKNANPTFHTHLLERLALNNETTYVDDNGNISLLDEKWISLLHQADDRIVYNNNKNCNPYFRSENQPKEKLWVSSLNTEELSDDHNAQMARNATMPANYETPDQRLLNDMETNLEKYELELFQALRCGLKPLQIAEMLSVSKSKIYRDRNALFNKISKK